MMSYLADVHVIANEITPEVTITLDNLSREECAVKVLAPLDNLASDRLHGYGLGTAPFVGFLTAGDTITPGTIARLVKILDDSEAVAAYSDRWYQPVSGPRVQSLNNHDKKWSFRKTLEDANYMRGLVLYRRKVLEEALPWAVDADNIDHKIAAACAMQGDFLFDSNSALLSPDNKTRYSSHKDVDAIMEVALSCSKCRVRLGLKPNVSEVRQPETARVVVKKCCGKT